MLHFEEIARMKMPDLNCFDPQHGRRRRLESTVSRSV
jgi:hypothetical protein